MNRRATVLLGVLVVVSLAAILGAAMLRRTDAHQDLASASLGAMQSRSLAWSGVLAAQAEFAAQRDAILAGEAPQITASWSIPVDGGEGVVRLVAWPGENGEPGPMFIAEAGRLDVNTASAEMLAKLPGMTEELGAAILAKRGAGLECVEALAGVAGIAESDLFGGGVAPGGAPGSANSRGLLAMLTTFAFDPNTQAGIGEGNAQYAGRARINLGLKWSEDLAAAFKERFGEDVTKAAAEIFKDREPLTKESQFLAILQEKGIPPEQWGAMLDIFTVTSDLFRLGKVDLTTATKEVLSAVPGIDAEVAEKIVQMRQSLSGDMKLNVAWPVLEGAMTKEQFALAVDWLTTRCAQYRVRIEAGIRDSTGEDSGAEDDAKPLRRRMVLEAVIDIAGAEPRVAYLRDVTHLAYAQKTVRDAEKAAAERGDGAGTESQDGAEPKPEPAPAEKPAPAPTRSGGGAKPPEEKNEEASDRGAEGAKDKAEPQTRQEAGGSDEKVGAPLDKRIGRWTSKPRR